MKPINRFLIENGLLIAGNPCISPDFCLDWPALRAALAEGAPARVTCHPKSRFETAEGVWMLVEDTLGGDCAWRLQATGGADPEGALGEGAPGAAAWHFPATWENLLRLKNLVQEHDPGSTIFPTAAGEPRARHARGRRALHHAALAGGRVGDERARARLTANQNSIPRELVYDVDAMLEGRLDTVPFPFIGTDVPEGHQGQSVEGMSHGCVLSKLRTGFHRRRIAWSFNADHQPVGGSFDAARTRW
jgi:hypothetical protein